MIYPNELQLKYEHRGLHVTSLDLDMTIPDGICKYKFYGKRDNYPLFIILMSDLSGNISPYVFYGSILSELLE